MLTPDMLPQRWREECDCEAPKFASVSAALEEQFQEFQEILQTKIADAEDECSICLGQLEADREHVSGFSVITMPCKHVYHETCLADCLAKNDKCPMCRHEHPQKLVYAYLAPVVTDVGAATIDQVVELIHKNKPEKVVIFSS